VTAAASPEDSTTADIRVDPDDPVFPGHYPGFAVLPGVYLIDYTDRAVRAWQGAELRLRAVDRCRFRRPVYPGDEVSLRLSASRTRRELHVSASAVTARGPAADLRLRYEEGTGP
jgi:3-hydroxyacyl-[acyl-carrier-protein] dehydratase